MGENQSPAAKRKRRWGDVVGILLFIVLLPILVPLGILYLTLSCGLHVMMWTVYCTRGINVLFVYSNSPHWQEYVEANILPTLPDGSLTLNWSERSQWKWYSLPAMIFRHFGGGREFNPMGIIFRPFRRTRTFRFYEAFKDFKHGNEAELRKVEGEFQAAIRNLAKAA